MKIKRFLSLEWDAIAGIVAAVVAIILHTLHIVDEHVILPLVLGLIALLFINFMRHTRNNELTAEQVDHTAHTVNSIQSALKHPDVILIGSRHLRSANEQFIKHMSGDTIWFNVCLSMYKPQPLFDALLRPAVENPMVSSIQFVLNESQRNLWLQFIQPQIAACSGNAKVREPRWCNLTKTLSFIVADSQLSGGTEALLSFWGEPFMAQTTERDVPRFIFHVQKNSDLLPHLVELERSHMLAHR
jgi:phosphate/sulfate permease